MATKGYPKPTPEMLWGVTTVSKFQIRIYVVPKLKGCEGVTLSEVGREPYIMLDERHCRDPKAFDELLMHEFVHVCETLFFQELAAPQPEDCSTYAQVFGKRLPELLRNLRRVGYAASSVSVNTSDKSHGEISASKESSESTSNGNSNRRMSPTGKRSVAS